jgi:hypothetical protein
MLRLGCFDPQLGCVLKPSSCWGELSILLDVCVCICLISLYCMCLQMNFAIKRILISVKPKLCTAGSYLLRIKCNQVNG